MTSVSRNKIIIFVLLLTFALSGAYAGVYSYSLNDDIDSVTNGLNDFGYGLFPLGTTFNFYKYFQLIPGYKNNAYFEANFSFSFRSSSFNNYDYYDGTPLWSLTRAEANSGDYDFFSGTYFSPYSTIDLRIQQQLGTNPVTKKSYMVKFRLGFYSYFTKALELPTTTENPVFTYVDSNGQLQNYDKYLTSGAFPWLQGNRTTWNNYIYIATYWYLYRDITVADTRNGLYGELIFQYGPSWLMNSITNSGNTSSDFYRIYAYADERYTLFRIKRSGTGENWLSLYVGHANSFSYVGGDVVPVHKIPSDRLRGSFSDKIWLHLNGPQFFGDSYPYIELVLNNYLYFGSVVNESSSATRATEYNSNLQLIIHLRLFGFLHFQYDCTYYMARGIWGSNLPSWSQKAYLNFYVAL